MEASHLAIDNLPDQHQFVLKPKRGSEILNGNVLPSKLHDLPREDCND